MSLDYTTTLKISKEEAKNGTKRKIIIDDNDYIIKIKPNTKNGTEVIVGKIFSKDKSVYCNVYVRIKVKEMNEEGKDESTINAFLIY